MTIIRSMIDHEIDDGLTADQLIDVVDRLNKLYLEFAHGVVAVSELNSSAVCTYVTGHRHKSNNDYSCSDCITAAQDGRG